MLLSPIRSLNHNINQETLIVYSKYKVSKGYFLNENINSNLPFDITVSFAVNEIISFKNYVSLSSEDNAKLSNGDIFIIRPNGSINLIYKSSSQDNILFVTEQCNNQCLMCSQPPQFKDDIEYYYKLNTSLIDLLPKELIKLCITGGEPTLLRERLIHLLNKIKITLPNTSVHLLSNGRHFEDINYVKQIAQIELHDFLIGIPFHSDFQKEHDYIAQSNGAYNETLKGLYNLSRLNLNIELRIVINQVNYKRLPQIAEYVFRNLTFVNHISFMAMEYTGFVPRNNNKIWIDPIDYSIELENAVTNLASWGMNVSIFNLPLCLLNKNLYKYAKKSISDWKTKYFDVCNNCLLREDCGGDFGTSMKHSINIKAVI